MFHLTPVHQESPLIINPALGHRAYQCHQYHSEEFKMAFILISYKDASDMIHFAHYVQHEDGFIGAYVEGVCPAKEDYEMVKKHFDNLIREQHPMDPNARLYRSRMCFYSLN